jgi:geranylgeranyl diphosphate synthase type II
MASHDLRTADRSVSEAIFAKAVAEIERDLGQRIDSAELPQNLKQAVRYSALDGGKRLRPALVLLCCDGVGGQRSDALPAAAAIELIHCFSLAHDDLPAMDDDDLRRGKPTLHIHAGEAMAILAGDVMVSLAFECISRCDLDAARRANLTVELAHATTAMIAGQVYDTLGGFSPSDFTPIDRLHIIHRNKTGALLRAACRMGAICGCATPAQLAALTRYGETMGLMFQIVDDLLDVTQSAEHIGKATGKDQTAGKLTFPGLLGIEASRREVARLREAAHDAINALGQPAQPLRDLCDAMAVRTK